VTFAQSSSAKLVAGDSITAADTSTIINANLVALLANANVDTIDSTEDATAFNATAAQAATGKLVAGDTVNVADTSASINAAIAALIANASVDTINSSNDTISLSMTQFIAAANKVTFFAANDVLTLNSTAATDVIADIDAVNAGGSANKTVKFAAGGAGAAAFNDVANGVQIADTDTFGGTFDTIGGMDAGGDKLDLTAFNLTNPANAITDFTATGSTVTNGNYIAVRGDYVNTTFTVSATGASTLVVWDGDTTPGISQVAVVLVGAGATFNAATDLLLTV
jgi:hypothetical protein